MNPGPSPRALAILAASAAIGTAADHPARRWLAARSLWRPAVELPPWLRWISVAALADLPTTRPGPAMVGSIVAPAAPLAAWLDAAPDWPRAHVAGVQLVNVAADGAPALDAPAHGGPLNKRSYGPTAGAVAAVGVLDASAGVTVAEGLADVLALAARFAPASVCTFGTEGMAHPATAKALAGIAGGATVYPDPDEPQRGPDGRIRRPGLDAAEALRQAIERHGGRLRRVDLPDGCDVAALAARDGWRDVDADALDGWRLTLADGRPAWECDRLAYAAATESDPDTQSAARVTADGAHAGPNGRPAYDSP